MSAKCQQRTSTYVREILSYYPFAPATPMIGRNKLLSASRSGNRQTKLCPARGIQLASFPSGASQSPSKSEGSESLTCVDVSSKTPGFFASRLWRA
jgi:hypothetical protein